VRTAFWLLGHFLRVARWFRDDPVNSSERNFVARAMGGEFTEPLEDAADDAIDAWHESTTGKTLHEYLGFTWDEYCAWVEGQRTIEEILTSRTLKR